MKENGVQGIVETHGPTAGLLLGAWGVQRLELIDQQVKTRQLSKSYAEYPIMGT